MITTNHLLLGIRFPGQSKECIFY